MLVSESVSAACERMRSRSEIRRAMAGTSWMWGPSFVFSGTSYNVHPGHQGLAAARRRTHHEVAPQITGEIRRTTHGADHHEALLFGATEHMLVVGNGRLEEDGGLKIVT